jgi:hypothetical protein
MRTIAQARESTDESWRKVDYSMDMTVAKMCDETRRYALDLASINHNAMLPAGNSLEQVASFADDLAKRSVVLRKEATTLLRRVKAETKRRKLEQQRLSRELDREYDRAHAPVRA